MRGLTLATIAGVALLTVLSLPATGATYVLPTANTNLFVPGAEAEYFTPTVGKEWPSGTFGCTRTDGWQFHEGIDIRAQQRDRRGEPTDPVMAIADGVVLYINPKAGLSNFGNYIVVGHRLNGLEVCTLYAHLREIREGLTTGTPVRAGTVIGTLGRTANTRSGISKDRAHLHLEVGLFLNTRFADWYADRIPGARNDHGMFNGQNLSGFDPAALLREAHRAGDGFDLLHFLQTQPELCRVQVRETDFAFLERYQALVIPRPDLLGAKPAGYEIVFSHVGVPMKLIPRSAAELASRSRIHLLSVNESVQREHPCRKLVRQRQGRWELAANGERLVDLLLH
jgi:hypothetical protein